MEILIAIAANVLVGLILLALFALRRPATPNGRPPEAEAQRILRDHFPAGDAMVTRSADGCAVLVALQSGDAAVLVERHGTRWNTRLLRCGDVSSVRESGEIVTVRLRDFGWPVARLSIPSAGSRAACLAQLRALASSPALTPMPRHHA